MQRIKIIFLVAIIACFAGCGPIYQTEYNFTPPKSETGKTCAYHCDTIRSQCLSMDQMRVENCKMIADQRERDCESDIRWNQGRDPKWYECTTDSCDSKEEGCQSNYRACYESCGGKAKPYTHCVANCEQPAK